MHRGAGRRARRVLATSLKDHADGTRERLIAERSKSATVDAAYRWAETQGRSGDALLAAAIAFRFFLFLVPCVFVLVMGLGLGAKLTGVSPREAAKAAGIAGIAATAIGSSANSSTLAQWVTLSAAIVAMLLAARNLLKVLLVAHGLIWRVTPTKPRRPILSAFSLIGILCAAGVILRCINYLRTSSFVGWTIGLVLYTSIPGAAWMAGSVSVFPRPPTVRWRDVLPGAVLFGLGVELLHLATVFWVAPSTESKSEAYGAIGAALTILAWSYLLGRLVTAAIALNATLWRADRDARPASGE
jgi:uncharacterized BrkB/YihY/UPF0761 family membrane protein